MEVTYPSLSQLPGQVIKKRAMNPWDDWSPDTPLRPYKTEASQTNRVTNDIFPFSYGDGYRGDWWLGWTHPLVKKNNARRIVHREGWAPWMSWSLWRQIEGSRYTECHHEWHDALPCDSGMLAKLNEVLDPKYGLANHKFTYMVTVGLAATFEDYLGEYFARPEVVKKIADMTVLE